MKTEYLCLIINNFVNYNFTSRNALFILIKRKEKNEYRLYKKFINYV